ncbi:HTR-like protein [Halorussus salilacus]|uniref:RAD55 family ATPase n=1 Tax=Halorussus salilacus TaxID=2953750 RepID=UPI00209CA484|nr:HTR-like protein [Halorussus salilacus]USZ67621.1 HTR-like protein [Halorussus salilacus]
MDRIPFGVSRLDDIIGGGAPPGSVVLLAGQAGAGAREFLFTSATVNGLAHTDPEQFDLHYGEVDDRAEVPDEIHYVSFTDSAAELRREIAYTMSQELVDAGVEAVTFEDLSKEYFQLSAIPTEWYTHRTQTITDLGQGSDRRDVLEALGEYFNRHAQGNLVVIDSLTDLARIPDEHLDWSDISLLVKGLQKASRHWDGLILVLVNEDALTAEEMGSLMGAADGTIAFEWETGGSERDRVMFVREFRGVLSRLEAEDIIRFETEIHEGGFDISNVRKIR